MTDARTPEQEYLKVFCPTCEELHSIRLKARPQTLPCSFCEAPMQVPSLEQVARRRAKQAPRTAKDIGEYALGSVAATNATPPAGKSVPEVRKGAKAPATVTVECPRCHERMEAVPSSKPRQIECTFCQAQVNVPMREALEAWKQRAVKPRAAIGEYQTGAPVQPPPLRMHLFDRMAEIRTEKPVPPPRWTFFSGVFNFPWRSDAWLRWLYLSLGFSLATLIGTFLTVGIGAAGGAVAIGLGVFVLPMFWITYWTVSYAANCAVCILESTAGGLDLVEEWPDPNWKEWMLQLIYLTWIASFPAVAAAGIGTLARAQGLPFWPAFLGGMFLLFPIVLLSAMEANSVWVPVTFPILKSLVVLWWGWLTFYVLSALLVVALLALISTGNARNAIPTLFLFCPVLSAAILIYFRLLGRLAWKIGQRLSR